MKKRSMVSVVYIHNNIQFRAIGFVVKESDHFLWIGATLSGKGPLDMVRISKKYITSKETLSPIRTN